MSKKDFLVELLVEEIPARFQTTAIENFSKIITDELKKNNIQYEDNVAYITPRRMVFAAKLETVVPGFTEEKKGPQTSAPANVVEKFLASIGVSRDDCSEKTVNNKTFIFANIKHEEKNTADLLGDIVKHAIFAIPWPKSMRWGDYSSSFVRPLRNILCVFDSDIVDVHMENEMGIHAVNYTFGHRFMHNKKVHAKNIDEYLKKMREAFVIVDQNERRQIILDKCDNVDSTFGSGSVRLCLNNSNLNSKSINVSITDDLLEEVVGLVEYPIVMVGKIADKFMRLPEEVIITTMQSHQRYFPTTNAQGKLAPYFVFVANNLSKDEGKAIRAGNERVLSARLSDALFFFEHDLTIPLERHLEDLKKIAFNENLGSVYDRTSRIRDICEYLHEDVSCSSTCGQLMLPRNSKETLKRGALLAKCDLATSLVCEFTELQGIMGAHYAHFQGESDEVCDIIRDQYKKVEDLYSPLCALYSMADKIDAITSLFAIGKMPTGSKDPFALRRAAIGIVKIIMKYEMDVNLREVIAKAFDRVKMDSQIETDPNTVNNVMTFILERLKVVFKEAGIDHNVINSVLAVPQDIQQMHKKANILNAILKTETGEQIIAICRRARNIIQGNTGTFVDEALFETDEEKKLFSAIKKFEASLVALDKSKQNIMDNFKKKLDLCLGMQEIMAEFFSNVLVNVENKRLQKNRMGILAKFVAILNNYLPEIANL